MVRVIILVIIVQSSSADDDLDVYFIDNSVPTDFIYNADLAEIIPGKRINFDDGSVTMRRNGDIDVTFSDSDSDSSTS